MIGAHSVEECHPALKKKPAETEVSTGFWALFLFRRAVFFFRLGANDPPRDADAFRDYDVETLAVLVRKYGTDFGPVAFAAGFFRLADDIGFM